MSDSSSISESVTSDGDSRGETVVSDAEPLLEVDSLELHYPITAGLFRREVGRVRAVDGVSFELGRGEALGIVGESGCGKTSTALATLKLEEPTGGQIHFGGESILEASGAQLRSFRRRAQLIVQDPNEAFNPRMSVGAAVEEPLVIHGMDDQQRRREIAEELIERVGLETSDLDQYPHEFSGGEKQRIAIARSLVLNPDLIVADEPTSALDGRIKTDILRLLNDIRHEFGISILMISHDLDVVKRFCDRVAVMYLGEIVERGPAEAVFESPAHPYTQLLAGSIPSLDPLEQSLATPLTEAIPDPADPPSGCRFHTRCPAVIPSSPLGISREMQTRLLGFRFTVQEGEFSPAFEDAVETGSAAAVRDTLGLPQSIPDDELEAGVAAAIDAILRDERSRASALLEEALPTRCEQESPTEQQRAGGLVACHRHDPAIEADPIDW